MGAVSFMNVIPVVFTVQLSESREKRDLERKCQENIDI
jgi:hypothetical protein